MTLCYITDTNLKLMLLKLLFPAAQILRYKQTGYQLQKEKEMNKLIFYQKYYLSAFYKKNKD